MLKARGFVSQYGQIIYISLTLQNLLFTCPLAYSWLGYSSALKIVGNMSKQNKAKKPLQFYTWGLSTFEAVAAFP